MNIFLSSKIPDVVKNFLSKYGNVILLEDDIKMPSPISSHPDSLIFKDNDYYCLPRGYDFLKNLFTDLGYGFDLTEEFENDSYPYDTLVNAFVIKNILFCGSSVSASVKEYAKRNGYALAIVKQGYTHCSSLVFKDSIITQDPGIYNTAIKLGIDCFKIEKQSILLPGYSEGFIGGSCINIGNDVIFYGDVSSQPFYQALDEYIKSHGGNIIYFKEFPLTDYGGGIATGE